MDITHRQAEMECDQFQPKRQSYGKINLWTCARHSYFSSHSLVFTNNIPKTLLIDITCPFPYGQWTLKLKCLRIKCLLR
jgi:hypothetical protein